MTSSCRLVVVLGSGGVGKTTSSAALSLALAQKGLRVAVITVDPAHRLAQALGLQKLSNVPTPVGSFEGPGKLSALWLDTASAFEDLVLRYVEDPSSARKILEHRLFKVLQTQLGGVEEYLGVEKILSLGQSGDFDVCVLDTPPSRHALDFLESPRHLIRFFDEGVLKAFVSSPENAEKSGFLSKLLHSGKQQALDLFMSFLGKSFLSELGDLLKSLKPVHRVFTQTAEAIEQWSRAETTRYVGVSLLEPYPLDEIRLLGLELESRGLPTPHLLVLNKCLPPSTPPQTLETLFGSELAQNLTKRHDLQETLRKQLEQTPLSSLTSVELLRYSMRTLDLDRLLGMGRSIVDQWAPKDPMFFSIG